MAKLQTLVHSIIAFGSVRPGPYIPTRHADGEMPLQGVKCTSPLDAMRRGAMATIKGSDQAALAV
ncbi:MAG TPA: hypothetical protein VK597_05245, partial [Inquilinus sp.]|nr:hypothetical protein [Inquilinus sp.]